MDSTTEIEEIAAAIHDATLLKVSQNAAGPLTLDG